jgi:hypothetical protein
MYQQTILKFKQRRIDRSPRLDTILMIEAALYKYKSEKTLTEIWRLLPKKVMWTTFTTVVRYLEYSSKIIIEKDKTVTWIWNPKLIEHLKNQSLVIK